MLSGPSRPYAPLADGAVSWRAISHLSLNYLSLVQSTPEEGAAALRDLLELYAASADVSARRQIEGIRSVRVGRVVRRLRAPGPLAFGRGLEITVHIDELAFEGASAFLLGSVLDRYFARHVSINSFTETVLRSENRGEINRWVHAMGRETDALAFFAALAEAPYRYDFYQTLRRLECLYAEKPRWGQALRPVDEPVRLGQDPDLSFAPAPLASFEAHGGEIAAASGAGCSACSAPTGRCRSTSPSTRASGCGMRATRRSAGFSISFIIGSSRSSTARGPRRSRTSTAIGRRRIASRPTSARSSACRRRRFAIATRCPTWRSSFTSGALIRQVRNAEGLAHILQHFFRVPVQIEEFVGHWLSLERRRADVPLVARGRRSAPAPCSAAACGTVSTSSGFVSAR